MAKSNELQHIGTVERLNIPTYGIFGVPAKVDTGADSSSIWASDVAFDSEEGLLQFSLFGPGSRYYTGERLSTKTFRSTSVKNSFGTTEQRYKVQLAITIGRRQIRAWFTLSDRAGMRYPILLGRRLLKNKFLVDVSKRHVHASRAAARQVLVLGAPEHRVGEFFADVASAMREPAEFTARSLSELVFTVGHEKVEARETITARSLLDFDLVYFKTHKRYYEFAVAAAEFLQFHHIPFFDKELAEHVMYDKLTEMTKLALQDLPVPLSVCGSVKTLRSKADKIIRQLGLPLVCKEINADRGRKNFIVSSKQEFLEVLAAAEPRDIFLAQTYVENDGYVRVLVFGSDVKAVVKRETTTGKNRQTRHLNNPAGSTNAVLLDAEKVPQQVLDLAVRAARCMRRQVAGIDIVQDKASKKWYILEVNSAPQIRSGSHTQAKLKAVAEFFDKELNR